MNAANSFASMLEDWCYAFLALNFFWGLYHLVLGFRRIKQLSFKTHDDQAELMDELLPLIDAGQYDAVEELCAEDSRALPQLAYMAVANRELDESKLRQLVAEVVQRDIISDLEYRSRWIATVIKSGPLLGLFGTVLGMMAAFGRIGTGARIQPSEIAGEISIALICTAMGLITAIPFNFMMASLNNRIRKFQDALGAGLVRILDALKHRS